MRAPIVTPSRKPRHVGWGFSLDHGRLHTMSNRLECRIESGQPGEPRVVSIRGEVDLATAPELESFVVRALEESPGTLVLDLEALSFIDSSGLRVLVAVSRDARSRGVAIQLRNVPRHAQRVLDLTGLSDWFDHAADS
jgi:anti-anti-sigma factor